MPYVTSTDGVRIFYTTTGKGDALVLSHGSTHTWESWRDLGYVDALKDHFRLVLIDSRGHGESDKPHDAAAYALRQQAEDVLAVLDDLGIDRFHVFGYSIGAQLCFHLAARAPERLRTFIAYGGHPYAPSPADVAFTEEINQTLRQGMQAWIQRMETIGVLAQYPNPAARRARLLAADPLALLAVNAAYVEDLGVSDVLLGITMPCLLIAGERDGVNDLAHRAVRGVSTADFVSVGGIAHAMVHAKTILPYVFAFFERFGLLPPRGQAASQTRHPAVRQTATML